MVEHDVAEQVPSALRCPECGRRMVILTFGAGLGHELRSCGSCDVREWVRDGERLGRHAVLADVYAVRDLLPGRRFR